MKIWCVLAGIAPVSLDNLSVKAAGVLVAWGEGLRELSSRPTCGTQGQGTQRSPLILQVEHTWTLKAKSKTKTGCAPQSYRDCSGSEVQQRGLNSTKSSRGCVRAAHATLHIPDRDTRMGCSVSRVSSVGDDNNELQASMGLVFHTVSISSHKDQFTEKKCTRRIMNMCSVTTGITQPQKWTQFWQTLVFQ